jgi:hypothetical protein
MPAGSSGAMSEATSRDGVDYLLLTEQVLPESGFTKTIGPFKPHAGLVRMRINRRGKCEVWLQNGLWNRTCWFAQKLSDLFCIVLFNLIRTA